MKVYRFESIPLAIPIFLMETGIKNIDIKVNPVTSEEFKRPAPRPAYSVLDNFMFKLVGLNSFRNWEESLKEYLDKE